MDFFLAVVVVLLSKQSNVRVCVSDMNWNSFEVAFMLGWFYEFFSFAFYIEHPLGRWLKAVYVTKCISIIYNSRENWFVFGSYALDYMRKASTRAPKQYAERICGPFRILASNFLDISTFLCSPLPTTPFQALASIRFARRVASTYVCTLQVPYIYLWTSFPFEVLLFALCLMLRQLVEW